jgi:hypothetical protein
MSASTDSAKDCNPSRETLYESVSWLLKGEGNAGSVFAYIGEDPNLVRRFTLSLHVATEQYHLGNNIC